MLEKIASWGIHPRLSIQPMASRPSAQPDPAELPLAMRLFPQLSTSQYPPPQLPDPPLPTDSSSMYPLREGADIHPGEKNHPGLLPLPPRHHPSPSSPVALENSHLSVPSTKSLMGAQPFPPRSPRGHLTGCPAQALPLLPTLLIRPDSAQPNQALPLLLRSSHTTGLRALPGGASRVTSCQTPRPTHCHTAHTHPPHPRAEHPPHTCTTQPGYPPQ